MSEVSLRRHITTHVLNSRFLSTETISVHHAVPHKILHVNFGSAEWRDILGTSGRFEGRLSVGKLQICSPEETVH